MKPKRIIDGVSFVGSVDWDRRLFDALIPLPDGTSYNAFVVEGSDQTVLIDTVDPPFEHELFRYLESFPKLDVLVCNHAEQDHAGLIGRVLDRWPGLTVLCTPKCRPLLVDELHVPEDRIRAVEDGETLDLGGRTLEFLHLPWVHWPETMVTWLREDRLLFTCDLFGSHLAQSDLWVYDEARVYEAAKRYYAEIMMPFHKLIRRHLERLDGYDIRAILPSHGPLYQRPAMILEAYKLWAAPEPENLVVLPFISMHDSTKQMAEHLTAALTERGIRVERFNLEVTDLGKLAIALVDAATVVFGTPTVLTGAHPKVIYAAYLANALRPKAKFGGIFGSFGWATRAIDHVVDLLGALKLDLLDPVVIKGAPRPEDFAALDKLADAILAKHTGAGLVPDSKAGSEGVPE
jgi:flavorubredoxin